MGGEGGGEKERREEEGRWEIGKEEGGIEERMEGLRKGGAEGGCDNERGPVRPTAAYLLQSFHQLSIVPFLQFGGLSEGKQCFQYFLPLLPLH